jgi:citrate synthase
MTRGPDCVNLDPAINMSSYLSAADAARRLGVTRATLYAYVSRGRVRSRSIAGRREREYLAQDIERLKSRASGRRDPGRVAAQALFVEGLPVLSSALTLIEAGRVYYRGRDVLELAEREHFEDVAAWLWGGAYVAPKELYLPGARARARLARLHFAAACQCYLASAEAHDPGAHAGTPDGVRRSGARIVAGLAALGSGATRAPDARAGSIAGALASAFGLQGRAAVAALEAALILCADHELNVSAFTARVIASAGATPYMALSGALGALSGHRHGGLTERVAALLDEPGEPTRVLVERLRAGLGVPGFGHPLYPDGDPRARRLIELAPRGAARSRSLAFIEAAERVLGERPVLDFGLVTLSRALGLPPSAPFALFAIGRSAGWIAHVLEQYQTGQLIRPRAEYAGPAPERIS